MANSTRDKNVLDVIERIYHDNRENMVRYAKKRLINKDNAEAVVQDVFELALSEKEDKILQSDNPKRWIYASILNFCRRDNEEFGCTGNTISINDDTKNKAELAAHDGNIEKLSSSSISNKQAFDIYNQVMSELSEIEVIIHKKVIKEKIPQKQVAEELGISYGALRVRVHELIKKLKKRTNELVEKAKKQ